MTPPIVKLLEIWKNPIFEISSLSYITSKAFDRSRKIMSTICLVSPRNEKSFCIQTRITRVNLFSMNSCWHRCVDYFMIDLARWCHVQGASWIFMQKLTSSLCCTRNNLKSSLVCESMLLWQFANLPDVNHQVQLTCDQPTLIKRCDHMSSNLKLWHKKTKDSKRR